MTDPSPFDEAAFLGLARTAKRDPYRLSLFAQHLEAKERPLVVLPIQAGTLIVTDRRILELRVHLEVHGAWNVKEFQGYAISRAIDRAAISDLAHSATPATGPSGERRLEDRVLLTTGNGTEEFLVSRGPAATLSETDMLVLREAVLGAHAK